MIATDDPRDFHVRAYPVLQHTVRLLSFLLVAVGMLLSGPLFAQTEGETAFGTQFSYAGTGAGGWATPGNVPGPPDNNCANMGAVGRANLTYNYSFSLPADAVITEVTAYTKAGEQSTQMIGVQLASNASVEPPTLIGSQVSHTVTGGGSGNCAATAVDSSGGALAFWGTNTTELNPAVVNTAEFGVVYTKLEQSSVKVDSVCLVIGYETVTGPAEQEDCFTEPQPETNTINVTKVVVGTAPATDWAYTGSLGPFNLPAAGGQTAFMELEDGAYTITETTKPGYTVSSECFIADVSVATGAESILVDVAEGETANCVFTNTLNTGSFTVRKDFSDDNADSVSVTATCTSGTVTNNPQMASEAMSAVFTVEGFESGATCTATEGTPPQGYTADESDCQDGDPIDGGCVIVNTANEDTFTVFKDFSDDSAAAVSVTASCSPGIVTNNPQPASEGAPAVFQVLRVTEGTTCTAVEDVPDGYEPDMSDCQDGDPIGGSCTIFNQSTRTSFLVTKDFSDDNPAGVTVEIQCNTGLPLQQSGVVHDPDAAGLQPGDFTVIEFVVGDFEPGTMDCDIEEVIPAGYVPTYTAGATTGIADAIFGDEDGCHYELIESGRFTCAIFNELQPVEVVVEKEWIDEHPEFQLPTLVEVTLECDAPILGGFNCGGGNFCAEGFIDPANPGVAQVLPHFEGSTCTATEEPIGGVVTDESDCESMVVFPGQGASCVIVNTRLFAGIPALNQFGLMLLVLMMLGVGVLAYRRFV